MKKLLTEEQDSMGVPTMGHRLRHKTKGSVNIRTGTVIGITGYRIIFRGDCGTKTWRAPKNLEVTERTRTEDEF